MSFLTASHHTRAFNYESIRDQQEAIEMWRDLAIGGGLLLLGLFCPPAGGFVLAASLTMSAADMYSATTGKDWGTGRELSTEERILRGGFALLELVPGIGYLNDVAKSGGKVAVKNVVKNSLKEGFEQGAKNFDNIVKLTSKFGDNVLSKLDDFGRQADQVFNKLASKGADSLSTGLKNVDQGLSQAAQNFRLNMGLEPQLVSGAMPSPGSSSINKITNKLDDFSKALKSSELDELNMEIPSVRNGEFNQWFDNLTPEELEKLWENPQLRKKIEDRIRKPGGYHEWHLVSRTPKFKRWGVSMDDIKEMRTLIDDVEFVNPPGVHGGRGSTKAHNEILKLIDESETYEGFVLKLNAWARQRLKNGIKDLPSGLRRY